MKTSTRLYAWLKLLAVLHIVEQLIFGMQDLHELQHMLLIYENWFASSGKATAALIAISEGPAILGIRCIISGGFARFAAMFVLGLPTIGELHHLVATVQFRHYTPGTVTAVPSIILQRAVLVSFGQRISADRLTDVLSHRGISIDHDAKEFLGTRTLAPALVLVNASYDTAVLRWFKRLHSSLPRIWRRNGSSSACPQSNRVALLH